MIVELGHLALVIAFVLSLLQAVLPFWGYKIGDERLMASSSWSSIGVFVFIAASFASLMWAYAASDFSVINVWQNSHSKMPFLFKLTGTWGNHEGSMLLWVLTLATFAAAVAVFGSNLPLQLKASVLAVQGLITSSFLLFVLLTSNPFLRQAVAVEGRDLNPVLQDIGLAIHPPLLYFGYVGFSVTFSFAIAALIVGQIDAVWARWVRPWVLAAWIFLTAGIAMGSYWAYYELGWGGWWFWDPVENASFLPWLAGTALLHSALVMEKRDALKIWTVLLAILTFSLSLLGTFLVRSGVLTSVHSFASDPARGLFVLTILCIFVGGSLSLFAYRASRLQAGGLFAPISREGALVLNNLLLCTATATVLVGTLYPLIYEAFSGGQKISVGAPFFNLTFGALMVPVILVLPLGPLLSWKRGDLGGVMQRLFFVAVVALIVGLIVAAFYQSGPWLAPVGIGLAAWLMLGSFAEVAQRMNWRKVGLATGITRLRSMPRTIWSTAFAHFGVGVTLLGIVCVTAFETETIASLKRGEVVVAGEYTLKHEGFTNITSGNYREQILRLTIKKDGQIVAIGEPSKRFFPARQMPTNEASIHTFWFSQLYIALGDIGDDGQSISLRIWWKPLITLIWLGTLFMVFAGLLSLSDRRFRLAAPRRSKAIRSAMNEANANAI